MWETLVETATILTAPLLAFGIWRLWRIETNSLPHIEKAIAKLQGKFEADS